MVFRDDQRQTRDLGRKIPQLDPAIIGQGNVGAPLRLAPSLVDLVFQTAHFLVGDDKEVARTAGGIENTDLGHARAQIG